MSSVPRFQTVLAANTAAMAALRLPSSTEVVRVSSIDGVGKDGQFRLTARTVVFNPLKNVNQEKSLEIIVPPQWLNGRKIQMELAKLLKVGAVVFFNQKEGNIVQKRRDITSQDGLKNYNDLTVVLSAEKEAELFAAGNLKETSLSAAPAPAAAPVSAPAPSSGASWEDDC